MARGSACWRRVTAGRGAALYADGAVLAGRLAAGQTIRHTLAPGMQAYLVPASGSVTVNGTHVGTRDGAAVEGETELTITAETAAELVLVETK